MWRVPSTTPAIALKSGLAKRSMKPTWLLACAFVSAGSRVMTEIGSPNSVSIAAWTVHSSSSAVDHAREMRWGRVCGNDEVRQRSSRRGGLRWGTHGIADIRALDEARAEEEAVLLDAARAVAPALAEPAPEVVQLVYKPKVAAHVGREDRGLDNLAERGRLVAEVPKVASEQVVEVVPPQHVDQRHRVEVL